MKRFRVGLVFFFVVIWCTACTQKKHNLDQVYSLQIWHLPKPDNWHVTGRLGFFSAQDSWSAVLDWQHDAQADIIELSGPFGYGKFLLKVTPSGVKLFDGKKNLQTTESVEQVIEKYYGLALPVNALKFWIVGGIEPNKAFIEHEHGFLQRGWSIQFSRLEQVNQSILPGKIQLEKSGVKVKLVIDQWTIL